MQIGKSKAKVYIEKKTGVTFADVEGIEEAEEELVEVSSFSRTRKSTRDWAVIFPKAYCWLVLQVQGRLCLHALWRARQEYLSLVSPAPTLLKCLLVWERRK
jgi:hypothetical protein